MAWDFPGVEPSPYQLEWDHLIAQGDPRRTTPYNEVKRGVEASLVTSMGRMACPHRRGRHLRDDILNSPHEFAPDVDKLVVDGPAPLQVDAKTGKYPWPQPGIVVDREY